MINNTHQDQVLVDLLQKGSRKAFEQLFKKYWPLLFDAAYRRVQSKELAEDLVQELFADIWCKRAEINVTDSIGGYLFSSLKYKILNQFRSNSVKNKHLKLIRDKQPIATNAVEESVLFNGLHYALESEIRNLPQKCQMVFNLRNKGNLSYKEIARQLNISVNTVEKHMGKALRVLRKNLKDYIVTLLMISQIF